MLPRSHKIGKKTQKSYSLQSAHNSNYQRFHENLANMKICCVILILTAFCTNSAHCLHLRGSDHVESDRNLAGDYYYSTSDESVLGQVNIMASVGNPLKGLMGSPRYLDPSNFAKTIPDSLEFYYMGLDQFMFGDPEKVGDEIAFDWSRMEMALDESASRKKHAVLRVYLHYPGETLRVPQYLIDAGIEFRAYTAFGKSGISPYYGDATLLKALEQFIREFGDKYDGDHRIGFIQMGLLGFWGEWHTMQYTFIPQATKEKVVQWFDEAFNTTQIQTRYPLRSALAAGFGFHDDSYAANTLDRKANGGIRQDWYFWPSMLAISGENFYRTGAMGGETRERVFKSSYPGGTYSHQDFNECTRVTHATYIGHHAAFSNGGFVGEELKNALMAHAKMGYNFKVSQVAVARSSASGLVDIDVTLVQVGVAPFFYSLNLALDCPGIPSPITLGGVETIVVPGDNKTFHFESIPATSLCFDKISLSLDSPYAFSGRPVLFAQGDEGTVSLSLPLPAVPSVIKSGAVLGLALINSDTDTEISPLTSGDTINLMVVGSSLNLRADAYGTVNRVEFRWINDDGAIGAHAEGAAPWAMGGNIGSDYRLTPYLQSPGSKTVAIKALNGGIEVGSLTITFEVVDGISDSGPPTTAPISPVTIEGFTLINANSDKKIGSLSSGQMIDLAQVGLSLTISAETVGSVASVVFSWIDDAKQVVSHSEGAAPWAMKGNIGSNFFAVPYLSTPGSKTVTAKAYESGNMVGSLTISFTIVKSS
jgi:hypothetical protein